MLAFVLFIYALCIYTSTNGEMYCFPESASEHGVEIDQLCADFDDHYILLLELLPNGCCTYFAFKYRGKKEQKATFFADNDKLEFIWTIIPVIVLAGLIIYGLFTWTDIMNVDTDDDPLVVELYAYQFDWRARYAGDDNTLGEANVRLNRRCKSIGS